jgi:hypothetical protein
LTGFSQDGQDVCFGPKGHLSIILLILEKSCQSCSIAASSVTVTLNHSCHVRVTAFALPLRVLRGLGFVERRIGHRKERVPDE